jgi:hypothetical protein
MPLAVSVNRYVLASTLWKFLYYRRGAENNYRYKGRVTRDKEKQRRYSPLLSWKRAEVR